MFGTVAGFQASNPLLSLRRKAEGEAPASSVISLRMDYVRQFKELVYMAKNVILVVRLVRTDNTLDRSCIGGRPDKQSGTIDWNMLCVLGRLVFRILYISLRRGVEPQRRHSTVVITD